MQGMEADIAVLMNLPLNNPPVDPNISPTPVAQEPDDDHDVLVTFLRGDGPPGPFDDIIDLDASPDGQGSLQENIM